MSEKDVYIRQLEDTIKDLKNQVSSLSEMILLLRKGKFGSSSEKTPKKEIPGQLSLFNEAETETDASALEPVRRSVKGYVRTNPKTKREEQIRDLPVVVVPCFLPEEEMFCAHCHTRLKPVGEETVREELEYIPAQLRVLRYVRTTYECPDCRPTEHRFFKKARYPSSLMNHSLASPGSVARVMYRKYVNAVPLYRQEKDWERLGLSLSRATMANWVIRCAEDYLIPVTGRLHELLLKRDIVHCDETTVQVLKEDGKKPQTNSYMWLYRTGEDGRPPVILFDYQPSRNGDHAAAFLKGFHGYAHSDGFQGYNKPDNVVRCGCRAHLRRKFLEAVPKKKPGGMPPTAAETGLNYCNRLFEVEKSLKECPAQERFIQRQEREKPILEAFWEWISKIHALPNSALGKALAYANSQRPYMENYLLDGRLSISNNAAENAIRPFTVGRKNWLFADTPKGAKASAAVYSLIETAKANGLDVFAYLEHLLMYMRDSDRRNNPDELDDFLPWSERAQEECRNQKGSGNS